MGDLYSIHPGITRAGESSTSSAAPASLLSSSSTASATTATAVEISDLIKAQIASHPRYPSLLSAYIECRKVGAPPEIASLLEEIRRDGYPRACCGTIGADPELDEFMEAYLRVLVRYKEELSKPLDEATSFLTEVEAQLRSLCNGNGSCSTITTTAAFAFSSPIPGILPEKEVGYWDEAAGSSEEELSCVDLEASEIENNSRMADSGLKEMLLKKYSGYLSNLRKEFLKKRKKGKLPKDARMALLDWWNNHYRWPYPTDEDKVKLADATGLDQKQINNWFINQRKRHWKPSDDMRVALMEGVSGGSSGTMLYFDTGTVGP